MEHLISYSVGNELIPKEMVIICLLPPTKRKAKHHENKTSRLLKGKILLMKLPGIARSAYTFRVQIYLWPFPINGISEYMYRNINDLKLPHKFILDWKWQLQEVFLFCFDHINICEKKTHRMLVNNYGEALVTYRTFLEWDYEFFQSKIRTLPERWEKIVTNDEK